MCGLGEFFVSQGLTWVPHFRSRSHSITPARKNRAPGTQIAYGSEVIAFGDGFIPGTKVPGFYREALCASFCFLDFALA